MAERTALRFLALVLACYVVNIPRKTLAESSHAVFSSGYPRVEHQNGTTTFKLFAALDRAGAAYLRRRSPGRTRLQTPRHPRQTRYLPAVPASSAGERSCRQRARSRSLTQTQSARLTVRGLPDESTFDVFFRHAHR